MAENSTNKNRTFDLIVWDWDGTIANSTGTITNAIVKAAEQVGLPTLDAVAASNIIGLGLKESINVLYGDIPTEKAQALAVQYTANYYAGESEIPLFDGVKETLEPKPDPVVVDTSKPVGADTTKLADKQFPETAKVCSVEAVFVHALKAVKVPVCVIDAPVTIV